MSKLVILATHNKCKIKEFRQLFEMRGFDLEGLDKFGITADCDEPHDTLQFNAIDKVNFYHKLLLENEGAKKQIHMYNTVYIASEDSGLYVKSLPNELGVKSKRFAASSNDDDNNVLLLETLHNVTNRDAYYDTSLVISPFGTPEYIINATGRLTGVIADSLYHTGFAYDKLFKVNYNGQQKFLGELSLEQKNEISSRRKAIDLIFTDYLIKDINLGIPNTKRLKDFVENIFVVSAQKVKENIILFSNEIGKSMQFGMDRDNGVEVLHCVLDDVVHPKSITSLNSYDLIGRIFKKYGKEYTSSFIELACMSWSNRGLGLLYHTMTFSRHSNFFTPSQIDIVKSKIEQRINSGDFVRPSSQGKTFPNDFFKPHEDTMLKVSYDLYPTSPNIHDNFIKALESTKI